MPLLLQFNSEFEYTKDTHTSIDDEHKCAYMRICALFRETLFMNRYPELFDEYPSHLAKCFSRELVSLDRVMWVFIVLMSFISDIYIIRGGHKHNFIKRQKYFQSKMLHMISSFANTI